MHVAARKIPNPYRSLFSKGYPHLETTRDADDLRERPFASNLEPQRLLQSLTPD
jgi:hypothetical protein